MERPNLPELNTEEKRLLKFNKIAALKTYRKRIDCELLDAKNLMIWESDQLREAQKVQEHYERNIRHGVAFYNDACKFWIHYYKEESRTNVQRLCQGLVRDYYSKIT